MKQEFTEAQTRKLISAYGGVGSIIETIYGALMVKPFNKWWYFKNLKLKAVSYREVFDLRLLRRIQHNFPKLERFIAVPPNIPNFRNSTIPDDEDMVANAEYFPRWFYCPKCSRLKKIKSWWRGWQNIYPGSSQQIRNSFTPPKCSHCYKDADSKKQYRRYFELEQVRFIMTAPNGEIRDVPWARWTIAQRSQPQNDNDPARIDLQWGQPLCCEKQDLRYITSNTFSDFSGIRIKCANKDCTSPREGVTLAGLFSLRMSAVIARDENGSEINILFKPVLRTSNSVYYPIIWNSIYLPQKEVLSKDQKEAVRSLSKLDISIENIASSINVKKEDVQELLAPNEIGFISEEEYRWREYQFLIEKENFQDDNLSFVEIPLSGLKEKGVKKLLQIRRLKMTSVQTGYTRQEPLTKDEFAQGSEVFQNKNGTFIKAKYTSDYNSEAKELPAIESYGEGFFIELDENKLNEWFEENFEKKEAFKKRLEVLDNNSQQNNFTRYSRSAHFENSRRLAKFLVLHTFSHLLIKELEFLSGYPSTSIQERLYLNDHQMNGVMIYTIAGSEGSYGGLISQATGKRFERLFNSALERAKDCASDPVCYNSPDGQGISGLNLAACYSCALLPEISCEEFNGLLDRGVLIDKEYGFFR